MINIPFFTPSTNDQSIYYLSKIFGTVSGVLGQGDSITLLSTMFKTFNSIILIIAVLMLVYVTILGVIGTAHEGEFMGKKMNNIWIPLRAVLGIALLVPTTAGYCGLQIIIMWVIVQGIGAADTLWSTVLNYVDKMGSPYAQMGVPSVGSSDKFRGLFTGLVCDATLNKADPKNLGYSKCPTGNCNVHTFNPLSDTFDLGECGSLKFCNIATACIGNKATTMECYACKAQFPVLVSSIVTMTGIAKSLVDADYAYRDFYQNSNTTPNNTDWSWIYGYCASAGVSKDACCIKGYLPSATCKANPGTSGKLFPAYAGSGTPPGPENPSADAVKKIYWPFYPQLQQALGDQQDFIKIISTNYQQAANAALSDYISTQKNSNSNLVSGIVSEAKNNGWIFAGALYYELANMNSTNTQTAVATLEWTPGKGPGPSYRNNMSAAGYLVQAASGNLSTSSMTGGSGSTDFAGEAMNDLGTSFSSTLDNTTSANPLLLLQIFGMVMLILAQVLFLLALILIMAFGIASGINVFVLGTGVSDPLEPVSIMLTIFLVPLFWGALGLLTTVGASLAIYTPLLPYIYFTFGALAWIISTIEAMVAGPLVALGIISPSGQHEIMGKGEPALLLLFNLFLRPSLMIFGLIAAMLLAVVAVEMVNATFGIVFKSNAGYWIGGLVLSLVFVLVAYVSLILAVLNKCFAVINLIPQQVIRWISGQGEAVEAPTGEMKGAIDSAAGKAGGYMGAGTGAGEKLTQADQQQKAAAKKSARQDAKDQEMFGKKLNK